MSENISLKEALEENVITMEDIISKLTKDSIAYDGGSTVYRDGGSKKISGGNLTIIECNWDYYIGNEDLEYQCR